VGLHSDDVLSRTLLWKAVASRGPMRVAVLHDHLRFIGGGERVALTLAAAFDADLYVTDLDPTLPERAGMPNVRATEIARVPETPLLRQDRQSRAFRDRAIPEHDVYVLSGNWAVFAAPRLRPNVWYCHTPVRVFYDLRDPFLSSLPRVRRWVARRWIEQRRPEYETAASAVQTIVANSRNVEARIERFLHRKAEVVHPPVDTARYRFGRIGDAWLAVTRLSHEKRLNLLVDTFRLLPRERVVIVGGPQLGVDARRLIRGLDAPANVEFVGEIPEPKLLDLYATCRGLVVVSEDEDFGLTPVEAMAAGKAVVGVDDGGYRETVVHGETGWLVPSTAESLAAAISSTSVEGLERMRGSCERRAATFDQHVFVERMRSTVQAAVEGVDAGN
jgi:glycosyltransferase involved in cell wall biosynthesis